MRFNIISCLLVLLISSGIYAKDNKEKIKFKMKIGFGNNYKEMAWTPVLFELENTGNENREITIQLDIPREQMKESYASQSIFLPQGSKKQIWTTFWDIHPSLESKSGVKEFLATLNEKTKGTILEDRVCPYLLSPQKRILLCLENEDNKLKSLAQIHDTIPFHLIAITPADMPNTCLGLSSVSAIVWQNPEPDKMFSHPSQKEALLSWIRGGGRLFLIFSQLPSNDSLLREIMPVNIEGTQRLESLDSSNIESTLSSFAKLQGVKFYPSIVIRSKLKRGKILVKESEIPLIISSRYHFGEVTQINLSPDGFLTSSKDSSSCFWMRLFNETFDSGKKDYQESLFLKQIKSYLNDIPQLESISFDIIALIIVIYILVVGPIDYFVLKYINRLEWTWITFSISVILFSIVAYWNSYSIKGGEIVLTQVSVVDFVSNSRKVNGHEFFGIFSPANDRYSVGIEMPGSWCHWIPERTYKTDILDIQDKYNISTGDRMEIKDIPIYLWTMECFGGGWESEIDGQVSIRDFSVKNGNFNGVIDNQINQTIHQPIILSMGKGKDGPEIIAVKYSKSIPPRERKDLFQLEPEPLPDLVSSWVETCSPINYSSKKMRFENIYKVIYYQSFLVYNNNTGNKNVRLSITPGSKKNLGGFFSSSPLYFYGEYSELDISHHLLAGRKILLGWLEKSFAKIELSKHKIKENNIRKKCVIRVIFD